MVLANESIQAALEKVQTSINRQLDRQYRQLVDSFHGFLDDLFNHPLERPWPLTLARFAAHWDVRGLRLTGASLASIERLIEDRLGPATGDQFAEGPLFPELPPLNSDAVSPYASTPATIREAQTESDGKISFYAKWQAVRVQRMFGLSEEQRIRLEFYYHDQSQRMREGRPLLPEPLFLYEAKQRHQAGPSMQPMTDEQVAESVRREEEQRYWDLPPEERRKLDLKWEREARRKFAAEHGGLLGFLNPGLPGNFNELAGSLGGFAGAGAVNRSGLPPLASRARARRTRSGSSRPTTKPKTVKKVGDRAGKQRKSKPDLPPPVDTERVPERADGSVSENLRLAAESEAAMARFLHSRHNIVVIYWGQKQGMHGADIITFNLRTKQVTLWDVKYRTSAVRLQPSKTFRQGTPARENAIQQAMKAFKTSSISNADKTHAIGALKAGTVQTVTVRAGNAKNSTIGD